MSYFVCLCLETRKAQEEIDALREKYNNSVIEYDLLFVVCFSCYLCHRFEVQFRKIVDDIDRLQADVYHAQQQIQDIPRFPDFLCPVVGIVFDSAVLIYFHLIAFHDPL